MWLTCLLYSSPKSGTFKYPIDAKPIKDLALNVYVQLDIRLQLGHLSKHH